MGLFWVVSLSAHFDEFVVGLDGFVAVHGADPFSFGEWVWFFFGFGVGGRCDAASGGEALSEGVEAEELVGAGGWGVSGGGAGELSCGLAGGEGEVQVGLVADGGHDGFEGGAEGGSAEPFSEAGRGGPELGWRAGGVGAEGSEKKSLGACGAVDVRHKILLLLDLDEI